MTQDRIVRLGVWPKLRVAGDFLMPLAVLILGLAVLWLARAQQNTVDLAHRIEEASECRYDLNAPISDANDEVDYWTWKGFVAVRTDDEAGVMMAIRNGNEAAERLRRLQGDRGTIAERCSAIVADEDHPSSEDP